MAKRFTDTLKWADEWFTELDPDMKLVWLYLLDNCDHAGIWKRSIKLLKYHTGTMRDQCEIEEILGERIIAFNNDKWFIPKFLKFQYSNGLDNNAPVIISVREALQLHNLTSTVFKLFGNSFITLTEQLDSSYVTAKDKDKDKEDSLTTILLEPDFEKIYKKVKHLSITFGEMRKLIEIGYKLDQIHTIFNSIENYKHNKKYLSLYLTANNWLKKEYPEITSPKVTLTEDEQQKVFDSILPQRKIIPAI